MSVRLPIHMKQLSSHWTDFHEFDIWGFFWKCVKKFQVSLISNKNSRYCTVHEYWYMYIYDKNITEFFLEWKMFQRKKLWRQSKHTFCVQQLFFMKIMPFLDDVENICQSQTDHKWQLIWHICFACWITYATDLHSEYVILSASPWWQSLHRCRSVLHFTYHCHSCWSPYVTI
jgi:hypothetical protein